MYSSEQDRPQPRPGEEKADQPLVLRGNGHRGEGNMEGMASLVWKATWPHGVTEGGGGGDHRAPQAWLSWKWNLPTPWWWWLVAQSRHTL